MTAYANEPVAPQDTSHDRRTPQDTPGRPEADQDDVRASELLTVGQAAQEAGVFASRIQNALSSGRLPYVTVGASRYRFVTRSDLEAWAEQLKGR